MGAKKTDADRRAVTSLAPRVSGRQRREPTLGFNPCTSSRQRRSNARSARFVRRESTETRSASKSAKKPKPATDIPRRSVDVAGERCPLAASMERQGGEKPWAEGLGNDPRRPVDRHLKLLTPPIVVKKK